MSTPQSLSLTKVLRLCEGTLGTVLPEEWDTTGQNPRRSKAWMAENFAMRAMMKKKPALYTLGNLVVAIEYCRRKGIEIDSPRQLFGYIESALERAVDMTVLTDVETQRAAAIDHEVALEAEDSDQWLARLNRAQGPGLFVALSAWRANRFPQKTGK